MPGSPVRGAMRPKRGQPAGNSRRRARSSSSAGGDPRAAAARRRSSHDQKQYQRGLKGLEFQPPFDDDEVPQARAAWEAGVEDREQQQGDGKAKGKRSSGGTAKGVRGKARQYAKPSGRRRAVTKARRRRVTRAAGQLAHPVARQATTAGQALLMTFVVVAMYLVLSNAGPLRGFLGGIGKALEWVSRPDKSIPYGQPK